MKAIGVLLIIIGFLFSLSGIGALIGIPLIVGGIISFFYPIFSAVVILGLVFGAHGGATTAAGYYLAIAIAALILLPLKHFVFDKLNENDPIKTFFDTSNKNVESIKASKKETVISTETDDKLWELAFNEANDESKRIPSIWARAFAESLGDEKKAVAVYIKLRVESTKYEDELQNNLAEKYLSNSEYKYEKLDGFDCFFFPNGECAVKDGKQYAIYDSRDSLMNSLRSYGYTNMHDPRGLVRTIDK
jgi:hypothetical protein